MLLEQYLEQYMNVNSLSSSASSRSSELFENVLAQLVGLGQSSAELSLIFEYIRDHLSYNNLKAIVYLLDASRQEIDCHNNGCVEWDLAARESGLIHRIWSIVGESHCLDHRSVPSTSSLDAETAQPAKRAKKSNVTLVNEIEALLRAWKWCLPALEDEGHGTSKMSQANTPLSGSDVLLSLDTKDIYEWSTSLRTFYQACSRLSPMRSAILLKHARQHVQGSQWGTREGLRVLRNLSRVALQQDPHRTGLQAEPNSHGNVGVTDRAPSIPTAKETNVSRLLTFLQSTRNPILDRPMVSKNTAENDGLCNVAADAARQEICIQPSSHHAQLSLTMEYMAQGGRTAQGMYALRRVKLEQTRWNRDPRAGKLTGGHPNGSDRVVMYAGHVPERLWRRYGCQRGWFASLEEFTTSPILDRSTLVPRSPLHGDIHIATNAADGQNQPHVFVNADNKVEAM